MTLTHRSMSGAHLELHYHDPGSWDKKNMSPCDISAAAARIITYIQVPLLPVPLLLLRLLLVLFHSHLQCQNRPWLSLALARPSFRVRRRYSTGNPAAPCLLPASRWPCSVPRDPRQAGPFEWPCRCRAGLSVVYVACTVCAVCAVCAVCVNGLHRHMHSYARRTDMI